MKKIFCQIFLIGLLIITPYASARSEEFTDGAYSSDQIYLDGFRTKEIIINKEEPITSSDEDEDLSQWEKSLPEYQSEEDEDSDNNVINIPQTKPAQKISEERPLFKKMIEKGIIRTDIPIYWLEDELTFKPKKGPLSKIEFIGAYNGFLSSNWVSGDYDTNYTNNFIQVGAMGKFRGSKNEFKVLFNPKGVHGRNYMQNFIADAFITNNSIPHHQIIIGYSRNQVGKEGGSSSYILPFIMRSQIARNFGSTRALGVRAVGNYDLIDYSFAFNSSDRWFRKWFAGPEFTGWIDFKPLGKTNGKYGKLVIGGGLNTGKNDSHYTVGSVYVGYKYKKLWSRFEYGIADGYNGSRVVNKKAEGLYAIIGYKITPKFQVIARYDQFNPDRDTIHNTRREYTAGINYFIKGQALKLILNYVFCQNQNAPNSHRLMIGTQILL